MPHHHVFRLIDGEKLPKTHPHALVHWPKDRPPGYILPEATAGCECDWCEYRRSDEFPGNKGLTP